MKFGRASPGYGYRNCFDVNCQCTYLLSRFVAGQFIECVSKPWRRSYLKSIGSAPKRDELQIYSINRQLCFLQRRPRWRSLRRFGLSSRNARHLWLSYDNGTPRALNQLGFCSRKLSSCGLSTTTARDGARRVQLAFDPAMLGLSGFLMIKARRRSLRRFGCSFRYAR